MRSLPSRVPAQNRWDQGCVSGTGFVVSNSISALVSPDAGDVVEPRPAARVLVDVPAVLDLPLAGLAHELPRRLHVAGGAHAGAGVAATGGVTDGGPRDVAAEGHPPLEEVLPAHALGRDPEQLGDERVGERVREVAVPEA